eukprot:TRINITY_DN13968_c0_g1_i2.p1 TRINITY_DN13968_c0_g1~~TRINITY_DN13968_c0_g1_i2.p1  ORF type:complete len:368 (+),score=97.45 TRINITY_DN13968_c0_g1_i2:109-1104(+)
MTRAGILLFLLLVGAVDGRPVLTFWNNTYYTTPGNHPSLIRLDLETNASETIHTQYDPEWSVWEGAALCDGVYVSTYITVEDVGMFYVDVQTNETKSFVTGPHYYTYACHPSMKGYAYAATQWLLSGDDVFGLSLLEIRTGHSTSIGNFSSSTQLTWEGFPNMFQFDLRTNTLWGSFPTPDRKSGYLLLLDLTTGAQLAQYAYDVPGYQPYELFPAQGTAESFTGVVMDPSTMMQYIFYTFKLDNATMKVQPISKQTESKWIYSWTLPPVVCGTTAYAFKNVESLGQAPVPHDTLITWDVVSGVQGPDIRLNDFIPGKRIDGGALTCAPSA